MCSAFTAQRGGRGGACGDDLELGRGEVLCVLGPSGAGRAPCYGSRRAPAAVGRVVRVLGRDISRMPARSVSRLRHELMGFLGQYTDTALSPDLRMRDAVALPLALRGMPSGSGAGESMSCSRSRPWRTGLTHGPQSCPVASASGLRCARPSLTARHCCSPMSRPANSTTLAPTPSAR